MRSYYPDSNLRVVWWILGITVAVFVLQNLSIVLLPGPTGQGSHLLERWFALGPGNLKEGKFWTLLTYALLHEPRSLFHIGFNMLIFFFVARILVESMGSRRLVTLYVLGALLGGLVFLLARGRADVSLVGASASVFALLAYFCRSRMDEPQIFLIFFVLPVRLKPRWILYMFFGISLFCFVFFELQGHSGVAHSAHLGGLLAGVGYFRFVNSIRNRGNGRVASRPRVAPASWIKKRSGKEKPLDYEVNLTDRDTLQEEVDRILDKINESGFGSLTDEEKKVLDRAKNLLRR